MTQPTAPAGVPDARHVVATIDLAVTGMTCASCVARVEKKFSAGEFGADPTPSYPPVVSRGMSSHALGPDECAPPLPGSHAFGV